MHAARAQFLAVIRKEIRQTVQDRRVVALLTIAPFLQLLVFGFAIDLGVDRVGTRLVDLDRTETSREMVRGLFAHPTGAGWSGPSPVQGPTLLLQGELTDLSEAEALIERGETAAIVYIPPGFGEAVARGESAQVQVIADGSDPTRSGVAVAAALGFFQSQATALARERLTQHALSRGIGVRSPASLQLRPRLLYNPELSSPVYMIPGIAGMLLLIVTTVVTSMGLARERELGTLEALQVTPIPSSILLAGKLLPYVVVGLLDVTAAIAAGAWVFDLPLRGSLLLFYGLTSLYLLTTVGTGLLISTFARTQQQAFLGGFMFILPAMLLSGTLTPVHAMPEWLQPFTHINPLRHYMQAIRAVLLKGAGIDAVVDEAVALMVLGSLILGLAVFRVKRQSN